ATVYVNTGQWTLAPEHARRAFELRDRVSERERFFIGWRYYRDALQAWDKALDLARSWTDTYPRESFAFNSVGNAYIVFGAYEQAIDPLREAIRLEPRFAPSYGNLAAAYLALNRLAEARATLQQAEQQHIDFAALRRIAYLIAFIEGDEEGMVRHLGGTGILL